MLLARYSRRRWTLFNFFQGVIDGDLCEMYATLGDELKSKIADDLQRTPPEVQRKLEIMRDNTN
jgi:hypothetical protein